MSVCRLCNCASPAKFFKSERPFQATYLRCAVCDLIQMAKEDMLSPDQEKSHYENHKNILGDAKYEAFLGKLLLPMLKFYRPETMALDFGCGPVKAMAHLFNRKTGQAMKSYDPIFGPGLEKEKLSFDFLTSSETVEHFNEPAKSWDQLIGLLRPDGILGVMTSLAPSDIDDFANWPYRFDRTHVAFYSENTFKWLANKYHLERLVSEGGIQIFKKL